MRTPARPAQLKRRRRPPAPALLHLRRPAQRLLLALRALRREQLLLRASRAPPLLAADARPLGQSGLRHAAPARLELVEQVAAREETVQGLRALALALDDHAGRPVAEHDTGGHLVDVLPALPARADEVLLPLVRADAERPHARGERVLLLGRAGEHAGRLTIRPVGWPPPRGPRLWRRHLPHFLDGASGLSGCRACARSETPPYMQNARPSRVVLFAVVALVVTSLALASFPTTPPNDPFYAPATCPPMTTCNGPTGQWNLLSTNDNVPTTTGASGISADLAWQVTTGRPDTIIGVLDSGVDDDHEDLRNKVWLNCGELPAPEQANGQTVAGSSPGCREPTKVYDLNGDGVFNVQDYAADPRVADLNGDGVVDRGDLAVFADGVDDDGDGYVDDLSGWDAVNDDNDEFDDRFFGHGTGRAGIVAPETNNALGVAGICPQCPLMNVRIDYTYVCSSAGVAKGAIFAVDHGARVINMSLGCTTASRMLRGAFEYARRNNVLAFDAMANEFSFHQNVPAIYHHVVGVGAITANNRNATTTWLQKANFSNFGAHVQLVGPTDMPGAGMGLSGSLPDHSAYSQTQSGTSSSTPHAVGVAALVFSRARDLIEGSMLPVGGLALPDISVEEVRQILERSTQDVTPTDGTSYAVSTGWDKWTGYGRLNAKAAVDMVAATTIPPDADMTAPDWYALVDGMVPVLFYANARWASTFGYTLEFAAGVEPTSFTPLASASGLAANPALSSADLASNFSATWDTTSLANGIYTLRLRVTDNHGNVGEDRRAVWVRHPDPQDQPGFPRQFDGSPGLSVALVALDDDNALEIIFGHGNGEVHPRRSDGTEVTGFPVHADPPPPLPPTSSPAFLQSLVPVSYSPIIGGVAVADLDGDGQQEIVVGAEDGKVYCWHADARAGAGLPVATDPGTARDQYGTHQEIPISHPAGIGAVPALGDLDGDGKLEIVVGTIDQELYVWHADGSRMAPFPMVVFDPSSASGVDAFAPRAIIASAAIADVDNDGANEIVISTDETYASPSPAPGVGGSGRAYVIKANGTTASGWPVKPTSINPNAVPLVAQGVVTSPVVADLSGNGTKQIALGVFLGDATIYNADGTTMQTLQGTFGATGAGSDMDETTPEGGLPRSSDSPSHFYVAQGAFADIHGLGQLDYLAGEVGNGIVASAAGSGTPILFDHLLSAWNATTGAVEPAFPRVIEDWQFFNGPAVAEISGDTLPEIIDSSGGYFVHAFNAAGVEPARWPKLTGHWQTSTPSIGDINDDGHVDLVQTTRIGTLFVWQAAGATCQPDQWRKFRHDEWNTGTYGADTRRPARIDDLRFSISGTSAKLTWTAPGDDGKCGTPQAYELRASATPITRANFASATPIAIAPPAAAGTTETRTFTPPAGALFYALRAVDEVGNKGPIASVGALDLRRVRMRRPGGGQDKLILKGRIVMTLAQLGLPGQDVTVSLTNGGPPFFSITVPASALVPNSTGTKVTFRGTIGSALVRLRLGGRTRTDVSLSARDLNLGAAAAGPVP